MEATFNLCSSKEDSGETLLPACTAWYRLLFGWLGWLGWLEWKFDGFIIVPTSRPFETLEKKISILSKHYWGHSRGYGLGKMVGCKYVFLIVFYYTNSWDLFVLAFLFPLRTCLDPPRARPSVNHDHIIFERAYIISVLLIVGRVWRQTSWRRFNFEVHDTTGSHLSRTRSHFQSRVRLTSSRGRYIKYFLDVQEDKTGPIDNNEQPSAWAITTWSVIIEEADSTMYDEWCMPWSLDLYTCTLSHLPRSHPVRDRASWDLIVFTVMCILKLTSPVSGTSRATA